MTSVIFARWLSLASVIVYMGVLDPCGRTRVSKRSHAFGATRKLWHKLRELMFDRRDKFGPRPLSHDVTGPLSVGRQTTSVFTS